MNAAVLPFTVIKGGRRAKPRRPPASRFMQIAAEFERRHPNQVEFTGDIMLDIMGYFDSNNVCSWRPNGKADHG